MSAAVSAEHGLAEDTSDKKELRGGSLRSVMLSVCQDIAQHDQGVVLLAITWQSSADPPLLIIRMVVYLPLAWRHESRPLQSHCYHTLDPAPAAHLGVVHVSSSTVKEGSRIHKAASSAWHGKLSSVYV